MSSRSDDDIELGSARLRWASDAKERLVAMTEPVERLRRVFEIADNGQPETAQNIAAAVITACGGLTRWLNSSRAPRGYEQAEAEIGAAAGVYRNAAVVFQSLADADSDQRPARSNACVRLVEQGDHHVETFLAALAKKVGDARL